MPNKNKENNKKMNKKNNINKNNKYKILIKNKKAYHDYFILERIEAGLVLVGTEIKSIRQGKCNLKDSYAKITKNKEIFLYNFHISPYENSGYTFHDPDRPKKLLLHKKEINKLWKKVVLSGYSLVPLSVYIKDKYAKIELALVKGKKIYDKRETLKKKDMQREIERKYF